MEPIYLWNQGKEIQITDDFTPSTVEEVVQTAKQLKKKVKRAQNRPVHDILDVLDNVSDTLAFNPEKLAKMAGISKQEAAEEAEIVKQFLKKDNLIPFLETEFQNIEALDDFIPRGKVQAMYRPFGLFLHNLAGNAIIVAPGSLAIALVTKNVNLLKLPSNDFYTGPVVAKEIAAHDKKIGEEISTMYWKGSNNTIYDALFGLTEKQSHPLIDACIAWGGHNSIKPMKEKSAQSGVHFVEHGPKMSFAVYFSEKTTPDKIKNALPETAKDIVKRRGRACKSPRFIAFQQNEQMDIDQFAELLRDEILNLNKTYPPIKETFSIASEMKNVFRKKGYNIKIPQTLTNDAIVAYANSFEDVSPELIHQCGDRAILVVSFKNPNEIIQFVEKHHLQPVLQTISIVSNGNPPSEFIKEISFQGVTNIVNPGEMDFIHPGDSHDGEPNFSSLTMMTTKHKSSY